MENLEKKLDGKKELFGYLLRLPKKDVALLMGFLSKDTILEYRESKLPESYYVFYPEDFGMQPGGALEKYAGCLCLYFDSKEK